MPKTKEVKKEKGKILVGKVVSLKMKGTAVVEVERKTIHPLYKKVLTKSKRFKADTNSQEISVGDLVKIIETKPISKNKYFKVQSKIMEKGNKVHGSA